MDDEEWGDLLKEVEELGQFFPDTATFIGGMAVWNHCVAEGRHLLAAMTHDVDFVIGMAEFSDLKELEVVSHNTRLGKHEFIRGELSFDVYVQYQNSLAVPADEIISESETVNGVRVANLGHLLKLKAIAAMDRKNSTKGQKDADDIVRILLCLRERDIPANVQRLDDDELAIITDAVNGEAPVRLTRGNLFQAKALRTEAREALTKVIAVASPGLEM